MSSSALRPDRGSAARCAVTGYAAILPGADGAEAAWDVLAAGRCTVTEIPDDRWSSDRFVVEGLRQPGVSLTRAAGVLDAPFAFDPAFFGIPPAEAEQMDPQQRLLLMTVARAFEHAGVDPARLDGDRAGVFVGASSADYALAGLSDPAQAGPAFMLGNTLSILSNRVAFLHDFHGPSFTVDTACSSGMFALDQARRALEAGEIDLAVVGATSLLLSPLPFVGFSQAGMLSPEGLCRAFGKGGEGYVRAEGAVVFVLERAEAARAAGRRVRSELVTTVTGSAGRTAGIALPSDKRQQALMERAMDAGGFDPADLAFVEAHGTGTAAGDPREARAIGGAYGARRDAPLPIGSAKTNFGHLEPAAGLVGVLKAQMALEHGMLPASLHAETLNPDIDWDGLNLSLAREALPLPEADAPRLAAVNSFGFGGANAHAVLREGPGPLTDPDAPMPPALLISAATQDSLVRLATAWRDQALAAEEGLGDRVATANHRRALHRHRLCVPAGSPEALRAALDAWLDDAPASGPGAAVDTLLRDAPVAFVFSGNGALWAGAGAHMMRTDTAFAASFRETAAAFADHGIEGLEATLLDEALDGRLGEGEVAQPLTFALQLALVDALAAAGLRPDAVLGHSLGEVAAAVAAGRLSRAEGARIVASRVAAFAPLQGTGTMAAFAASRERVAALIDEAGLPVELSAENAPESVTVSGPADAVKALSKIARRARIAGRVLKIAFPYHSSALDGLEDDLRRSLDGIDGAGDGTGDGAPERPAFYSGWTGARHDAALDAGYWWSNAREAVAFRRGVEALADDGVGVLVEISPKTVLRAYLRDTLATHEAGTVVLETLDPSRAAKRDAAAIARAALAAGGRVARDALLGPARPVADGLPAYPFDLSEFRLTGEAGADVVGRRAQHPLMGGRLHADDDAWRGTLSVTRTPWLADHVVGGHVLLPGMATVEMFAAAARGALGHAAPELRDVEFLRPVVLPEDGATLPVRVTLDRAARRLTLETGAPGGLGGPWGVAAVARVFAGQPETARIGGASGEPEDVSRLYADLSAVGLAYGPAFARLREGRTVAPGREVRVTVAPRDDADARLAWDPAAADAVLHGAAALLRDGTSDALRLRVPARIDRVRFGTGGAIAGGRLLRAGGWDESVGVDVAMHDEAGQPVVMLDGLRLRPIADAASQSGPWAWWDEVRAPLPGAGIAAEALDAVVRGAMRDPDAASADADVLRHALGGRLAWGVAEGRGDDPRREAATRWLDAAGLSVAEDACPFPEIDAVVPTLLALAPEAGLELRAALSAATGGAPVTEPLPERDRIAIDLLAALPAPVARLALAGDPGAAVTAAARAAARHVTLIAEDDAALARRRAVTEASDALALVTLADAGDGAGFDLVLGCGIAAMPGGSQAALAALVNPGAGLLAVEEEADLFARMTGRHARGDALDALRHALSREGLAPEGGPSALREAVHVLRARRPEGAAAEAPQLAVHGDGPLAEALRALPPGTGPKLDVLVAAPGDAAAWFPLLRALPASAGPLWIAAPVADAPEAGLAWRRVAVNETERDIRLIAHAPGMDAAALVALVADTPEAEIVAPAGAAPWSPRVAPIPAPGGWSGGPRRLVAERRTMALDGLAWAEAPEAAPGPGEVSVAVEATGVNFRDAMWAQGLLPPEALERGFAGACLGMEFAGTVTAAGEGAGFAPGDRVAGFGGHAFADRVTADARALLPLPDDVSFAAGAALPVAWLTADYALSEVARVAPGETVLVHGAAGGVGLAAVQVAVRAGARVLATAGSEARRRLARAMGAEAAFDSRSGAFEADVRAATDGRGADVVLNALAGEAMERGLAATAPFGRFVELGKRDLYENNAVALRALRENVSLHVVDVDQLLSHRAEATAPLLARMRAAFASDDRVALPVTALEAGDAADALRGMGRASHMGKLVLRAPRPATPPARRAAAPIRGAWVVVGGTGGFGLETALWLHGQGAERLVLVSRSGRMGRADRARAEAAGLPFAVLRADVADEAALAAALDAARAEGPIRGVVHAATVYDNARMDELSEDRVAAALAAKVAGGANLDRLTRGDALDHFVLFTSVATRFGSSAQGPYCAANAALEGLARRRHAEGLPALAVAWGPIADAGILQRSEMLRAALARRLQPMPSRAALDRLGAWLAGGDDRATVTIAPVSWSKVAVQSPTMKGALFDLVEVAGAAGEGARLDLAALIAERGIDGARTAAIAAVVEEAARVLRLAPADVDPRQPMVQMGFDSLLAMNLRLAIEERIGSAMQPMAVDETTTLAKLASGLLETVATPDAAQTEEAYETMARRHLSEGGVLGDDSAERIRALSADG